MQKLLVVLYALGAITSASAAPSAGGQFPNPSLLDRALAQADEGRETRPTGHCIVSCEDRQITLKRCPDGDCPQFDCRTGYANCGVR
jgi:hypothetical protein